MAELVSGQSSHQSSKRVSCFQTSLRAQIYLQLSRANHDISAATKTSSTRQHQLLSSKEQPSLPLAYHFEGRYPQFVKGRPLPIFQKAEHRQHARLSIDIFRIPSACISPLTSTKIQHLLFAKFVQFVNCHTFYYCQRIVSGGISSSYVPTNNKNGII